ncbi:hypothetical protein FKW77_008221 [Venturia effusa]|uniref:histidine kinase n=1 Tax=Venturia effusa TaxID=50376 RepID=A0A517L7U3_9PEZI|nr:hypothetical protein FKW77_008221 [Venturia effusa]
MRTAPQPPPPDPDTSQSLPPTQHPYPPQSTDNEPYSPAKSASRPHLQRTSAGTTPPLLDDHLPPQPRAEEAGSNVDSSEDETSSPAKSSGEGRPNPAAMSVPSKRLLDGSDDITVQSLRKQINEKMYAQQRRSMPPRTTSALGGARRVSPIKEEGGGAGISPTLEGAFESPLPTGTLTTSTESTESARTIRGGSIPATPNAQPLRTPSYPFPYVGTPRLWSQSSPFHRPFTTLSPTVPTNTFYDSATPHHGCASELSITPHGAGQSFLPRNASPVPESDEARFPTPNLFELTLELTVEPGLQTWWTAVSRILRRDFGVTRASLSVPASDGELESVPWGQKATFCDSGPPETADVAKQVEPEFKIPDFKTSTGSHVTAPMRNVHNEKARSIHAAFSKRPSMISRHSYAGGERPELASTAPVTHSERPKGPMRTKSHAPQPMSYKNPASLLPAPSPGAPPSSRTPRTPRTPSSFVNFSDPDFSSVESQAPPGPFCAIHPTLKSLDSEKHALIESKYVNRIIERGKTVILTRDYSGDDSSRKSSMENEKAGDPSKKSSPAHEFAKPREKGKATHDYFSREKPAAMPFDEYEQFPSSPWAQSPAPSPAVQSDPDENPFFTSGRVDEESFDPKESTPDYAKLTQVEAIGLERASTVIHIPFMHPLKSQNIHSNANNSEPDTPTARQFGQLVRHFDGSGDDEPSRKKAPIAILSILSPIVPYPTNLTHALKMLSLHLSTSYSNAHDYTSRQKSAPMSRKLDSNYNLGFPPFSAGTEGLDRLADIELDFGSATGSITSPSDYSGRSRASPGGSVLGTPGWDSVASFGKPSAGGTPGQAAEMIDNYFDAKKRSTASKSSSQSHNEPPLMTPLHQQASEQDCDTPKGNHRRARTASQDSSTAVRLEPPNNRGGNTATSPRRPTSKVTPAAPLSKMDRKHHSQLHSYGADFGSTFQGLSSTTAIPSRMGAMPAQSGDDDERDMLPPSERLLRTIIDALPVQIFTASPGSGALTWVNSKFVAYRGREPHEIIANPWEAIHPSDRVHYMTQWQRSLSTGQPFAHKVRLQRFDNQYRWFFVRATPLKDKRQNTVHWTGTYMDIHEQHVAEVNAARQQETAASEARYRALANSSPQIVFAVTQARGVIFCNTQWLLYAGQTEAQATALGFMDFVHPEDLSKCRLPTMNADGTFVVDAPTTIPLETKRQSSHDSSDGSSETDKTVTSAEVTSPGMGPLPQKKLSELAGTGILKISRDSDGRPSYTTEVRLRNKEGDYRWHLVRVLLSAPVRGADEEEEETWYGTCTDINDHKLLEQTLKETMDAKSRFLSNMSHEIRTPLNGITGMVNFLIDSHLSQEQLEHVHIIRNSTEGLRDLINDILDLSKVEAGMISLAYDWLHLRSLVEEVNDLTSAMAVGKGLELNYLIEDNVPPMVKGDRFRLRQVLLNVVGNAIKFTQHGEVFVNCEVCKDQPADLDDDEMLLRFNISDTGSGFTEKEAEFLFKRFSQIDSSSTKQHGGTGLGLAISMQLVELHGGKMSATSVPNKGSTFSFSVKFRIPSANDQPPDFPVSTPAAHDETIDRRLSSHIPRAAASYTPGLPPLPSGDSDSASSIVQSPIRLQHDSPASSGSSDPSIRTGRTASLGSHRSSASSLAETVFNKSEPISLELPRNLRGGRPGPKEEASTPSSDESLQTVRPSLTRPSQNQGLPATPPAIYSILVVCPLALSRAATVKHIETTIPKNLPSHITAPGTGEECKHLLGMEGHDEAVKFTHIVVMLHDVSEIIALVNQALKSPSYASTSILIITDFQQRKEIEEQAREFDYKQLGKDMSRIRWVYKPLKPSKFAVIFDPEKLRELSTDRSHDSAQAVVVSQKQVFEDMRRRLGNRGIRVLLVEDNKTNQMVLLKFLKRSEIEAETALDGVQCTDKVFSQPHDYYSIILCDLHMPNKDGYQTCKEIRRWERKNKYKHLPIIALSANVLGDVYAKCVEAGFNSYVTKPVDFKELGVQMNKFLDPDIKGKNHEFMKNERANSHDVNPHHSLRLLSLDGGGVRGLSSLLIVQDLMQKVAEEEKRLGIRPRENDDLPLPCDYFDLIGGTSTGGIIAILLGRLRLDVRDCIKIYSKMSAIIFKKDHSIKIGSAKIPTGPNRFSAVVLESAIKSALKAYGFDENERLWDESLFEDAEDGFDPRQSIWTENLEESPVAIKGSRTPNTNRDSESSMLLSTANGSFSEQVAATLAAAGSKKQGTWKIHSQSSVHRKKGRRGCRAFVVCALKNALGTAKILKTYDANDRETRIWQALRATSAAPTFFEEMTMGSPKLTYLDGGMGFNNPAMEVDYEAKSLWEDRTIGVAVSIGTGLQTIPGVKASHSWLPFGLGQDLVLASAMASMATSTARVHNDMQRMYNSSTTKYFRFDVDAGMANISLEQWMKEDEMTALTEQYMHDQRQSERSKYVAGQLVKLSALPPEFEIQAQDFNIGIRGKDFEKGAFSMTDLDHKTGFKLGLSVPLDQTHRDPELAKSQESPPGKAGITVDTHGSSKRVTPVTRDLDGDGKKQESTVLTCHGASRICLRALRQGIPQGKYRVKWILAFTPTPTPTPTAPTSTQTKPSAETQTSPTDLILSVGKPFDPASFLHRAVDVKISDDVVTVLLQPDAVRVRVGRKRLEPYLLPVSL